MDPLDKIIVEKVNHFPKWPLSSFLIHPIENRNSIAAGTLFQKK